MERRVADGAGGKKQKRTVLFSPEKDWPGSAEGVGAMFVDFIH
jgi:hypothetical protein